MGVIETPPASTDAFYGDDYYGQTNPQEIGYADYEFTAEHGLLWARLMVEALAPPAARVLDVGCADGFLLDRLPGSYERCGIEVNAAAAAKAAARGIVILGHDIADAGATSGAWGNFDIITSLATFEHVLDLRGAFERCIGLLRSQGILLFEVPLVSDHRDNSEWFHSSYEHIYYPTRTGIDRLFAEFPAVRFVGFESDIKGYGSTYIGAGTSDPETFERLQRAFDAMMQPSLEGLDETETRLNLAYHVVHCFRPTPARIMALPSLLDGYATPNLIKRLTQLWWADSHANVEAQNTVTEYHKLAAALDEATAYNEQRYTALLAENHKLAAALDEVKAYNEQRHTALLAENHKLAAALAVAPTPPPVTARVLAGQVARRVLPSWVLRLLRPGRS